MADVAKASASECYTCRGIGYTVDGATRYTSDPITGGYKTLTLGCGCLRCGGLGQVPNAAVAIATRRGV